MASALAHKHIEAERRLRLLIAGRVEKLWRDLGSWDEDDVEPWLTGVLPLIESGQRASVALTEAYLARALERPAVGVNPEDVIGAAVRNGTAPDTVYRRPFVTVWTGLANGALFNDAVASGMARATELARFDVQAAMRATAQAVQDEGGFYGFQRVADGDACEFCSMLDGAYVKSADAMPMHPGCGCGLEPLTEPHRLAAKLPDGTAVHQHGELGALLGSPDHDFTGPAALT